MQLAFVLHSRPYRETSQLIELFCRDEGRMGVIARGARNPKSALRGPLQPFQLLLVDWAGRGELKTLKTAERHAPPLALVGDRMLAGFYANELLLKLLERNDAYPELFDHYQELLRQLRAPSPAWPLRRFEANLLSELGYAINSFADCEGAALVPAQRYAYHPEQGAVPDSNIKGSIPVSGAALIALRQRQAPSPETQRELRRLLQSLLSVLLGGRQLQTPKLLRSLQQKQSGG